MSLAMLPPEGSLRYYRLQFSVSAWSIFWLDLIVMGKKSEWTQMLDTENDTESVLRVFTEGNK